MQIKLRPPTLEEREAGKTNNSIASVQLDLADVLASDYVEIVMPNGDTFLFRITPTPPLGAPVPPPR